jgi:hypothetical protein
MFNKLLIVKYLLVISPLLATIWGCGGGGSTGNNQRSGLFSAASSQGFTSQSSQSHSSGSSQTNGAKEEDLKSPYVWTKGQCLSFQLKLDDFLKSNEIKINDTANKRTILEQNTDYDSLRHCITSNIVTANGLSSLNKTHIDKTKSKITLVFIKLLPGEWDLPIVGEVKFINGLRFQYLGTDSNDNISILLLSKNLPNDIAQSLKINAPWDEKDEVIIGEGGKGSVFEITINGRKIVGKRNRKDKFGSYVNDEISNYENLTGLDGCGPYFGYVGGCLKNVFGGGDPSVILLLGSGKSLKALLPTQSKSDVEKWFLPLLGNLSALHAQSKFHSDIKPANMIIFEGKPYFIDFDNVRDRGAAIKFGSGATYPYYSLGDEFGVKADLKAIGFTFFEMRYFGGRDNFGDLFEQEDGEWFFKDDVDSQKIVDALNTKGSDKIDTVIIGLLTDRYESAAEAMGELGN